MKKLLVLATVAAGGLVLAAAVPASAAGEVCYDVYIEVSGQAPIAQAGCQPLP